MAITLIAAAIATLEPEIAPNSTQASTVATPKPQAPVLDLDKDTEQPRVTLAS